MRVLPKPLAAPILRVFSVSLKRVCVCVYVCVFHLLKMSVHNTLVYLCMHVCVLVLLCVCPYLLLIGERVPVALVFFSGNWLPSKPGELIGIRITFLKGRSFSAGAEC